MGQYQPPLSGEHPPGTPQNGILNDYFELPTEQSRVDADIAYSRALLWIDHFKDAR